MIGSRLETLNPLLALLWLPWLVGLQSIPGTGALRTLMMLIGIAHIAWWWNRNRLPMSLRGRNIEVWLFFSLSLWLLFQASLLSATPDDSLGQFAREWFKLLLMGGIGIVIAHLYGADWRWLAVALFAGSFLHVLSTLGLQALSLIRGQGLVYRDSLLGNYGYVSPFTTAAFAWLLADTAVRLWHGQRLLPWAGSLTAAAVVATLAAEILLQAKAAQVMIVLLVLVVLAAFLLCRRTWHKAILIALLPLVFAATAVLYASSERWQGATESIRVAWDRPVDKETLTGNVDPQAKVNQVEQSFYLRMAWARVGLEGIIDHPMGLGYGADGFGRYVQERFGIAGWVSSHSGWIDFALANGIIGLALFLALAVVLIRRGWLSFLAGNPAGAALALLVLHFVSRALIDGHLSGSRLTGFALVAGALWAMCVNAKNAPRPD